MSILVETCLPIPLFHRGKVRDTYELGEKLLMIATDRISAFDVVLPRGIPDKGLVLNQLSAFWFEKTSHLVPNHVVEVIQKASQLHTYGIDHSFLSILKGRSMVIKRAKPIPVECVVRGYLCGSAWAEYEQSGTVNNLSLPTGLKECHQLPQPIFTPTTKARTGHDQPLTRKDMEELLGRALAWELEEKCLAVYHFAADYAQARGVIIADTKFEFGLIDDKLILIDELLTPDSSRFWDANSYEIGHPQPSFDKQLVRDWLQASGWNKEPPAPMLPPEIIQQTAKRYREAYHRLTGKDVLS